jgi:poly-gamma-glutamate synthesis protein (capsule biosynthesis protein)
MSGKRIINKPLLALFILVVIGSALWYAAQQSTELRFNSPFTFLRPDSPQVSILIVGDVMLDRNVSNKIKEIGFDEYFKGVKDLVGTPDIAVANLEGPFTTYPSKTTNLSNKELSFTFDPKLAPKLADLGFDILGLANNHTMNFGKEGFDQTKKYISDAGMISYGDPNNKDGISVITERNGITIGFIGFHEFTYINLDKITAEIDRLRPLVDFLVISPHWGIEYQKEATENMKKLAHFWIDRGADAVIGSHPHVIGDIEEYKGKKIFYSLGNFAFDQYFSKETSEGLAVNLVLEKDNDKIKDNYTLTRILIGRQGVTVSD